MSFVRSGRSDRRRRVIRESAAADSELAVETVRARKRQRTSDRPDTDDPTIPIRRDPGYSQAVRRACQQRLVQLIPVRRTTLSVVLLTVWSVWALLILSHYWIHVRPLSLVASGVVNAAASQPLPISYLLHLRSSHGIAHWLGGQLWMLTALSALMIFQLKRHKLDDYRAKYRVWMMLSIAALVSSMDASTSALLLLGKSIDAWALREVGYSGWALVLATFATLVGMLGLRLCSELKSAPTSLIFWLGGLLAWALSAVIGTGLLKTEWSQAQTDMIVGGAWLGGILSVFVASGIYLRHIYIQAQRRFVIRNGMITEGKKWQMPSLKLRRKSDAEDVLSDDEVEPKRARRQAASGDRTSPSIAASGDTKSKENQNANRVSQAEHTESKADNAESPARRRLPKIPMPNWKMPAVRLPKWKSDPKLGEDYSDVDADQRLRDQGFTAPMEKKPGWFAKRPKTVEPEKVAANRERSQTEVKQTSKPATSGDVPDFNEVATTARKQWWHVVKRSPKPKVIKEKVAKPASTRAASGQEASSDSSAKPSLTKKAWGLLPGRKVATTGDATINTTANSKPAAIKPPAVDKTDKPRGKWFGMLDGLKLKPPAEGKTTPPATKPIASKPSAPLDTSKPIGPPSSSSAARYDTTPPKAQAGPANRTPTFEEEDDDDDQSNRGMSRAERKRLKKQQQENRRAA